MVTPLGSSDAGLPTSPNATINATPGDVVRGGLSKLMRDRAVLLLGTVLIAAGVFLAWQQSALHQSLIHEAVREHAKTYSDAIRHVRTLYTSEVVSRLRDKGIQAVHNYKTLDGAIPLPATLSMKLGERIGAAGTGARTFLYSPFPFSTRQGGGLPDDFAKRAWASLQADPTVPFARFEVVEGRSSLRYATADLMRSSCIECHNTHPDSPKSDWQTGDLRGVLEVTLPVDVVEAHARSGLSQTILVLTVLIAVAMAFLAFVIRNLRRNSGQLAQLVEVRSGELQRSEALYHAMLDGLPLSIFRKDRDSRLTLGNAAFLKDMGRTPEELYGKSDHDLFPKDLADKYLADDQRVMASGEEFHDIEKHLDSKGKRKFVEVMKTPVLDHDGKVIGTQCAYWDVTNRVKAEESLKESEGRYRYLANALPQVVWTTGADGLVDFMNDRWEDLTGMRTEDSLGAAWVAAIHPDDRPRVRARWDAAAKSGETYELEARFRMADGNYRWQLVRALPMRNAKSQIVQWFGTCTDIESLVRAEEALRSAKATAEAANRAKGDFLANMSHEIRTPMNGIIGTSELLLETQLTPNQNQYATMIALSADRLLRLINDILDFSKIDAGRLTMESIRFDVRDTVSESLQAVSVQASQKGLELATHFDERVPPMVVGDPVRLGQIIVNLAGNAIKFTETGEIVVAVAAQDITSDRLRLHFAVRDTGIGIPEDKLTHIFEAFSQADSTTTRKFGGTGLGLTISARLATLMGGRMWAESTENVGSTFHFEIVVDRHENAPALALPAGIEGMRALIVDSNPTSAASLESMLASLRLEPKVAATGERALAEIRNATALRAPFELVLLSSDLGDMDALDVAKKIRVDDGRRRTRILMMTTGGQPDEAFAEELGVERTLLKPVKQSDMLDAIVGDSAALSPRAQDANAPAMPSLRVLLAEDGLVNQQLATILLEQAGHTVIVAENGRAAIEALAHGEFDLVIMDVQMPVIDGIEATTIIRKNETGTGVHIPIIAMTANAMKGDREKCLDAGMDGYVSKPIRSKDLEQAIQLAMPTRRPTRP